MLWLYFLMLICSANLHVALKNTDFSSVKNAKDVFVGIIYDELLSLESSQDLPRTLMEVGQQIQLNGSITLKYFTYKKFVFKSNMIAVVSVLSCLHTWTMFQQLTESQVIIIALTDDYCARLPLQSAVTVPLLRPGSDLVQILLDLRTPKIIEWESVAIICDNTIDNKQLESLVNSLMFEVLDNDLIRRSIMTMAFKIEQGQTNWKRDNNIEELMKALSKITENSNFLVIVDIELIGPILELIKEFSLMKPTCQWLFIIKQNVSRRRLNELWVHLVEGANIAFIYNHTTYYSQRFIGLEDQLTSIIQILLWGLNIEKQAEIGKSKKVSQDEWEQIKPSESERKRSILQLMKKSLHEEILSNNYTVWKVLTSEMWGHYFAQKIKSDRFLDIGYWNFQEGCIFTDYLFPHVKYGFRTMNLPIVSFHFPPWQIITYNDSGHATEFKGVVFEIINLIARKFNFTYNVLVPVNFTNHGISNGKSNYIIMESGGIQNFTAIKVMWENILHLVKEKKTFLAACALFITEYGESIVNFTEPVGIETYMFIISKPKHLNRALLFMLPFTSDAWLCIMGSIFIMSPTLYFIHKLSPFYNYYSISNTNGLKKASNCFWYIYGALLQQGGAYLPTADSGRLIIGTWWIVVLVLVTTYCGNLVAFLTFPKMDKVITTVDDLLVRKDLITWGLPDPSQIKTFLSIADDPVLKEFYSKAQLHDKITPEIIESIRKGDHALVQSKFQILYLMKHQFKSTNTCDFSLGLQELFHEKLGMMMYSNNPYLDLFNKEIGKMHRMGLIHKWITEYLPSKDQCWNVMQDKEVDNHTVNLDDMQGSFFILFLGIISASFVIFFEIIVGKLNQAKENSIQPFIQ